MIELIVILICFLTFGILTYNININSNQSTVAEFKERELEILEINEDLDNSYVEDNCDVALQTNKLNNQEESEK